MKKFYHKKFKKEPDDPFLIQEGTAKDKKLAAGYRLQWTEEGMLRQREAEMSGERIGRNISSRKINWLILFLMIGFLILFSKTAYLQIEKGSYYRDLADYNRIREEVIKADRGIIYDSDRQILAYNVPAFNLQIIPADIRDEDKQKITNIISECLGEETERILNYVLIKNKKKILESYQPQLIAEDIVQQKALELILKTQNIAGISVEVEAKRKFNLPSLSASHFLGYTGPIAPEEFQDLKLDYQLTDYLGKTGLEKQWEKELKGIDGYKQIEVDALGQEKRIINKIAKQDGHNLVLSINSALQEKLEKEVRNELIKSGAKKAAAIILNPKNGEILALVSLPSFNSNDFAKGIETERYQQLAEDENEPLFNRAISGEFSIGSTFKPIVAAAALQEGIINANTIINSTGGIGVKVWFFPDWKTGGHGFTNVRKALAWSVNTFFYYIGGGYKDFNGLGVQKITDYARLFGFGAPLGVDLPNEAEGFLPSPEWKKEVKKENWYIGDTYHLAIGQGDIIGTPLQVAAFTGFFANGGTLYQPHLVKELLDSKDELAQKIEPKVLRYDFIDEKHINTVRQGMREAVVYGSARSLESVPVAVAGKTGTAQWSSIYDTHAWFTGFAPYDDPEIVITILVEEAGEGSEVAVPIARRVLSWYFSQP